MSYNFPSAVINYITWTALRQNQFPHIQYAVASPAISAGNEYVTIAPDLSKITITIATGATTNAQILAALAASSVTADSLRALDLVSAVITTGHTTDTNIAVSATSLTGASTNPVPVETPQFRFDSISAAVATPQVMFTAPQTGMYQISNYVVATAGVDTDTVPTFLIQWTDETGAQQVYATMPASGNQTLNATNIIAAWIPAGGTVSFYTSGGTYTSAVYSFYFAVRKA